MSDMVSVLMPAHNAQRWLRASVESILCQSYTDFELIMIDDGSTDQTSEIVREFMEKDGRILMLRNSEKRGVSFSLNRALKQARGRYIARMDADDISLKHRLERQVAFMEANPEIGISSAWMSALNVNEGRIWKLPLTHDEIVTELFGNSPFYHPLTIIRTSLLKEHGLTYNEEFNDSQDYRLWADAVPLTRTANLPEVLLHYRIHSKQESRFGKMAMEVRLLMLSRFLGRDPTPDEEEWHARLFCKKPVTTVLELKEVVEWIQYLEHHNRRSEIYPVELFSALLKQTLLNSKKSSFYAILNSTHRYSPKVLKRLLFDPVRYYEVFDTTELLKIMVKSIIFFPNRYF